MTVYARSDLMSVSISPGHGGCGETHSRPVSDGAPDKVWALTCDDGCEDVLRNDPHWTGHPDDIPETPDEKSRREFQERAGQRQQQDANADALNRLAGLGDLPKALEQLAQIMTGGKLQGQPGPSTDECSNGHTIPYGLKFCPECGVSMTVGEDPGKDDDKSDAADDTDKKTDSKPAPAKKAAAPRRRVADSN